MTSAHTLNGAPSGRVRTKQPWVPALMRAVQGTPKRPEQYKPGEGAGRWRGNREIDYGSPVGRGEVLAFTLNDAGAMGRFEQRRIVIPLEINGG